MRRRPSGLREGWCPGMGHSGRQIPSRFAGSRASGGLARARQPGIEAAGGEKVSDSIHAPHRERGERGASLPRKGCTRAKIPVRSNRSRDSRRASRFTLRLDSSGADLLVGCPLLERWRFRLIDRPSGHPRSRLTASMPRFAVKRRRHKEVVVVACAERLQTFWLIKGRNSPQAQPTPSPGSDSARDSPHQLVPQADDE